MKLNSPKVLLKKKKKKFSKKISYLGIFFWKSKTILPFPKSVPSNFSIWEVSCKNREHLYLGQKMLYADIFRLEFEKAIVIFETKALKFL